MFVNSPGKANAGFAVACFSFGLIISYFQNTKKIGKVKEELQEFETEIAKADQEKMEQEFGDFLFSIINVARLYGINPENALEKTNRKFIRRFGYVEDKAKETGKNLSDMSLEEMEVYWQEAKGREQK